MRDDLIRRNELLEGIDDLIAGIAFTSPYQDELHCLIDGMERVRDRVAESPVLTLDDLRPKGRWIMKETMIRSPFAKNAYCSECNEETSFLHRFCPSCGADMRARTEE